MVLLEVRCPTKLENSFSNFKKRALKREYKTQVNVQMGSWASLKHMSSFGLKSRKQSERPAKEEKGEAVREEHLLCEPAFEQAQLEEVCGQMIEVYTKAVLFELIE